MLVISILRSSTQNYCLINYNHITKLKFVNFLNIYIILSILQFEPR